MLKAIFLSIILSLGSLITMAQVPRDFEWDSLSPRRNQDWNYAGNYEVAASLTLNTELLMTVFDRFLFIGKILYELELMLMSNRI
jgi:hypothetical protein